MKNFSLINNNPISKDYIDLAESYRNGIVLYIPQSPINEDTKLLYYIILHFPENRLDSVRRKISSNSWVDFKDQFGFAMVKLPTWFVRDVYSSNKLLTRNLNTYNQIFS